MRNSDFIADSRLRRAAGVAADAGINANVLSWNRRGQPKTEQAFLLKGKNVRIRYFNKNAEFGRGIYNIFNLMLFNLWLIKELFKARGEYKAVHVCDLDVAIPALIVKAVLGKKICYDIFDFYAHTHKMPELVGKFVAWVEYKVCQLSDWVIVCNESRKQQLPAAVQDKTVVIHNTPEIDGVTLVDVDEQKSDVFKICYVGTLPAHGRLLKEIIQNFPLDFHVKLDIAGSGPLEDFIKEAQINNSNVNYYGQVSIEKALAMQSASDLLFATYDPSILINKNSAPNKIYEAMALSKPIIVCKDTDADKIVISNEMGVAIKYSADEFWSSVRGFVNDKERCTKLGSNGRVAYSKKYSWRSMAIVLDGIYSVVT